MGAVAVQQRRAERAVVRAAAAAPAAVAAQHPAPPAPALLQAEAAQYELAFELNGKRACKQRKAGRASGTQSTGVSTVKGILA